MELHRVAQPDQLGVAPQLTPVALDLRPAARSRVPAVVEHQHAHAGGVQGREGSLQFLKSQQRTELGQIRPRAGGLETIVMLLEQETAGQNRDRALGFDERHHLRHRSLQRKVGTRAFQKPRPGQDSMQCRHHIPRAPRWPATPGSDQMRYGVVGEPGRGGLGIDP